MYRLSAQEPLMISLQDDSNGEEEAYRNIVEHSVDIMIRRVRDNAKEDRYLWH